MDKDFIKELNSYCLDHFKHFSCYPLEFEYNDKIYKWEQFNKYIKMSDLWTLIDADLSAYNHTKFSAGGRLYFIKAGRKNVNVYRYHARKNVSIRLSALPEFFFNEESETKLLRKYPNTFKNILKDFKAYKNKTAIEKNILDTVKIKSKIYYNNV